MTFCVSIFIFRLEPTVREQLDENDFRRCYGNFFQSTILKLLDLAMFKDLSHQLQDTLTTVFETIHYSWRFYGHGSPYELIFSWVIICKRKSAKMSGLNPSLLFEEHCIKTFDLLLIISEMSYCNVLLRAGSDINFIFCCSPNFCYSLFTFLHFDLLCILELIQSLHIFYKNQ